MRRCEFDHALRAAASILNTDELLVIGSQAIHATVRSQRTTRGGSPAGSSGPE